jgi:hypothetical protein
VRSQALPAKSLSQRNVPVRRRDSTAQAGADKSGCGTATTSSPSMPPKSSGLQVYTGSAVATLEDITPFGAQVANRHVSHVFPMYDA